MRIIDNFSIAISTRNERILQAIRLAESVCEIGQVVIIHQVDDDFITPSLPMNISYLQLRGRGVAKSRNAALAKIKSGFIWFLDDDVSVDVPLAKVSLLRLLNDNAEVDIFTFGVLSEDGKPRKKYSAKSFKHNLISILSVGTIEIVVNRDRLIDANCSFPEDMGAGSEIPIGDEPVFLSRCLKSDLHIHFFPEYFISHPFESSGNDFTNRLASYSRGVVFRRIFGFGFGALLLSAMFIKKLILGRFISRSFIVAYFCALRGLCKA